MSERTLIKSCIIACLILSTAFHEMAHAFTAYKLGDPTPGRFGRLTLNPIPHLQPVLTAVILPIIMYMSNMGLMMLAQTPIDPSRFRKPLRDHALVAVAGPLTNVAIAALAIGVLWIPGVSRGDGDYENLSMVVLRNVAFWNLILAVFNMIPIPPLDGYWIARTLLPLKIRFETDKFARNQISLVLVLLVGGAIIGYFVEPIQKLVWALLPT